MGENEEVEIKIKTIGPSPPSCLRIPSQIKVHDLRALISEDKLLHRDRLKIVLRGQALHDKKDGVDVFINLKHGDSLIVAVTPKPPAKHIRDSYDDEDDDDLKFHMPQSASWLKRKIFSFLHDKLRLPDLLLMAISSISLKALAGIILWFMLAPLASRWGLGPLYILGTGFAAILLNLGQRQQGEMSAYSIFNEDFRELPGTLNADHLDRDIRTGQF